MPAVEQGDPYPAIAGKFAELVALMAQARPQDITDEEAKLIQGHFIKDLQRQVQRLTAA